MPESIICLEPNEYRDSFESVNDPRNRFPTMTVPFQGGFGLPERV